MVGTRVFVEVAIEVDFGKVGGDIVGTLFCPRHEFNIMQITTEIKRGFLMRLFFQIAKIICPLTGTVQVSLDAKPNLL